MRKIAVTLIATLALLGAADTANAGFRGYLPPEYQQWIAEAKTRVGMPTGMIRISKQECSTLGAPPCYVHGERTIYTADTLTWYGGERKFVLLHEIGHAYDFTQNTPQERQHFRAMLRLPCKWMDYNGCDPIPAEMFAEQYAACAAGIPRATLKALVYGWFYEYAPPPWVPEADLCALMR